MSTDKKKKSNELYSWMNYYHVNFSSSQKIKKKIGVGFWRLRTWKCGIQFTRGKVIVSSGVVVTFIVSNNNNNKQEQTKGTRDRRLFHWISVHINNVGIETKDVSIKMKSVSGASSRYVRTSHSCGITVLALISFVHLPIGAGPVDGKKAKCRYRRG